MFMRSEAARAEQETWLQRHTFHPRYWYSDAGELLVAARAASIVAESRIAEPALRGDLQAIVSEAERHLTDVLGVLTVTRRDVDLMFAQLRDAGKTWPDTIPPDAWRRIERSRYLDDIADVLLGGGDCWMAVEVALTDEFEARGAR